MVVVRKDQRRGLQRGVLGEEREGMTECGCTDRCADASADGLDGDVSVADGEGGDQAMVDRQAVRPSLSAPHAWPMHGQQGQLRRTTGEQQQYRGSKGGCMVFESLAAAACAALRGCARLALTS